MRGLFFGLTTIDIQHYVDYYPQENIKIKTDVPDILVGGPATNAAIVFAALKGDSYLCSPVGENELRSFIINDFNNNRLHWSDVVPSQIVFPPVMATVITNKLNGNRTIISHIPEEPFNDVEIDSFFDPLPEILLIDGFYPQLALQFVIKAKDLGVTVVFDGGSWKPGLKDLLKYADYAICSSDFIPPGCKNKREVFQFLKAMGVLKVAITRGEKSILVQDDDLNYEIPVSPIDNIIDTLGAGDFFHGAFCYFILKNKHFCSALTNASEIAGVSCRYKGTREWLKILPKLKFTKN